MIEAFGILNTLIPADDHPWHGIPFPGTYVIDAEGLITHKFFEHSLAVRVSPDQLMAAIAGDPVVLEPAPPIPTDAVTVDVSIDGGALPPGSQREIVARFSVPPGQHLYGEPTPSGMVSASIVLDEIPGVLQFEMVRPATTLLTQTLTGETDGSSGETVHVYEGDEVILRRPIAHNGTAGEKVDGQRIIAIRGEVRWQACDDMACGVPQRERFELELLGGRIVRPDIGPAAGQSATAMNGARHFEQMTTRRQRG